MIKEQYLSKDAVSRFIKWLEEKHKNLKVELNIKKSRFVPQGTRASITGFDRVLSHYVWSSQEMNAGTWNETVEQLTRLASNLNDARSEDAALGACHAILSWGGNRDFNVGAYPYLTQLAADMTLLQYLQDARDAFALKTADVGTKLLPIERMNSMLTKVHALSSQDGMPIYDSRVAAAIATLVELWRRDQGLQSAPLPEELVFPATMTTRTVHRLFSDAKSPGFMAYDKANAARTAQIWGKAKIRLGWIMEEMLNRLPDLFDPDRATPLFHRMHAFEATLFMIGYDVACLAENNSNTDAADLKQFRRKVASAHRKLARAQDSTKHKTISLLSKHAKSNLAYSGDLENGFTGYWGSTPFVYDAEMMLELVSNFQGMVDVPLGSCMTGAALEGSLGKWLDDNHCALPRRNASAIAAILANDGLAKCTHYGKPIRLAFPTLSPCS